MAIGKSFWQKIPQLSEALRERKRPEILAPETPSAPAIPPSSPAGRIASIVHAGQNHLLLNIVYDGIERKVEPYELRSTPHGIVLYAWCETHAPRGIKKNGLPRAPKKRAASIHSFFLAKIQYLQVTETPFSPRGGWPWKNNI